MVKVGGYLTLSEVDKSIFMNQNLIMTLPADVNPWILFHLCMINAECDITLKMKILKFK